MRPCLVDLNVWVAVAHDGHQHHRTAAAWFELVGVGEAFFCRSTQMGFLRLLTNRQIAAACGARPRSLNEAWKCHDELHQDPRVGFLTEPDDLEDELRRLSAGSFASPKLLQDAYLAAFANKWGIALATFDRGFAARGGVESLVVVE